MPGPSFHGLSVLTLESRRAAEQATLIERFGGRPIVAPSVREVPLESQAEAAAAIETVVAGRFDCVVLLTGVGLRAWLAVAAERGTREPFVAALAKVRVVARGPKPLVVLRELHITPWIVAPEPNTWREVLGALDARSAEYTVTGRQVAVQEYGVSNPELLHGLTARGAIVTAVPIYQWELPEDLEPLRAAVDAVVAGHVDVVVLTSGIQLTHLWRVATGMGKGGALRDGLSRAVIASIGPTTTEEIRRRGLEPDLEASHPKMGILVTEAASNAGALLAAKRAAQG